VGEVFGIVVGVLTLEVTAGVDGLEEGLSVGVLTVARATKFPSITVGDDTSVTGSRVVSVEDKWLRTFMFLTIKAPFSRIALA